MDYDKIKINNIKNKGDIIEYFYAEDFFSKKVYNKVVDYISGIDNWKRVDEGFYKQYSFYLKEQLDGHNHRGFNYIMEDMKLKELAQKLEEVYSCELKNFTQIRVQKQVKRDFIGSHVDGGWDDFVPEDNKKELIKICGHYVFSDERFLKMKPNIDDKIKETIKNKLKELFDVK